MNLEFSDFSNFRLESYQLRLSPQVLESLPALAIRETAEDRGANAANLRGCGGDQKTLPTVETIVMEGENRANPAIPSRNPRLRRG
jgi:hypothetical protein